MSDPLATDLHDHLGAPRLPSIFWRRCAASTKTNRFRNLPHIFCRRSRQTEIRYSTFQKGRQRLQQLEGTDRLVRREGHPAEAGADIQRWLRDVRGARFLALGVRGTWRCGRRVSQQPPTRFSGDDFRQLADRAEKQFQMVEQQRLKAARIALVSTADQRPMNRSAGLQRGRRPCWRKTIAEIAISTRRRIL